MTIIWMPLMTMVVNLLPLYVSPLVFGHPLPYYSYLPLLIVPLLKVVFPDS